MSPRPKASTRQDGERSRGSPEHLTTEQQRLWNKWDDIDKTVDRKVLEKEVRCAKATWNGRAPERSDEQEPNKVLAVATLSTEVPETDVDIV